MSFEEGKTRPNELCSAGRGPSAMHDRFRDWPNIFSAFRHADPKQHSISIDFFDLRMPVAACLAAVLRFAGSARATLT